MLKSLITGGAGFIGSHVARHCLDLGHEVVVLDDLSGGYQDNIPAGAAFCCGSVTDDALVSRLFKEHRFDYVYHLAAYAAEGLSHFIRRYNYENNVVGTINLVNASVNADTVKRFVFTSSIAVYGAAQNPMTESTTPAPEDPYGVAKYACEMDLRAAHEMFGLNYTVFRPHNVYGEHQNIGDRYRNVIGIFMNQIMQGKPMTIFGDGLQTRAFTHIDDVAPIIARCVDVPKSSSQVFNIGAETPTSVRDLAGVVAKVLGAKADIRYLDARKEVVHAFSSSDKLQAIFGPQMLAQIDVLRSRQNAQGGFGLWTQTPDSVPFVSAYAMHILLEAKDRGVAVPPEMIASGNDYLQLLAREEGDSSPEGLRARAYAVYLLTRQGNVTTNSLAAVQKRLQDAYPNTWKNDLAAAWLAASYKLLKQDKEADALIAGPQRELERQARADESYHYEDYMDPLIRDSSVLYLLAKHFPDRARSISPHAMENISRPLEHDLYNTLSAGMTLLALDAYASGNAQVLDKLAIQELHGSTIKSVGALQDKLLAANFSGSANGLRFDNGSALNAWSVVNQAGYDRGVPTTAIKNGLEIIREYTAPGGKPLAGITVGDEIEVHVKIRATAAKGENNIAVVDLLPGGFDPVQQLAPAPDAGALAQGDEPAPPAAPTIRVGGSSWQPNYTDVREDRVVIYGYVSSDVREYIYRIKAGSSGKFIAPPAYGESMYDRRVQARAPGGTVLTVKPAAP